MKNEERTRRERKEKEEGTRQERVKIQERSGGKGL